MVVNRGSTSVTLARVITVASAEPVPSGLKCARWCRSAPTSSARPTMPLALIITAAKTVSRASVEVSLPCALSISVRISPTSITVTATASTSEPNGSPTRCATTSAWCTAASTAPIRTTADQRRHRRRRVPPPGGGEDDQADGAARRPSS